MITETVEPGHGGGHPRWPAGAIRVRASQVRSFVGSFVDKLRACRMGWRVRAAEVGIPIQRRGGRGKRA
jgi:hypothetical protein